MDRNRNTVEFQRVFRSLWPVFTPENLAKLYKTKKDEDADLIDVEEEKKTENSSSGSNSSSEAGQ